MHHLQGWITEVNMKALGAPQTRSATEAVYRYAFDASGWTEWEAACLVLRLNPWNEEIREICRALYAGRTPPEEANLLLGKPFLELFERLSHVNEKWRLTGQERIARIYRTSTQSEMPEYLFERQLPLIHWSKVFKKAGITLPKQMEKGFSSLRPESDANTPLRKNERHSLLLIVGALQASLEEGNPIPKGASLPRILAARLQRHGHELAEETIRRKLRDASSLLSP